MTGHFPSYSITSWPGCATAKLQAVQTADRKLCAAVTAIASWLRTGKLFGTLMDADDDTIEAWINDVCFEHNADPEDFMEWAASVAGQNPWPHEVYTKWEGMGPNDSTIHLDEYQVNAIKSLTASGGVIGAFMGAGKTVMAVAAAHGARGRSERCWIICPLNAMPAWEKAVKAQLQWYFKEVRVLSVDSAHKYTTISRGDVLIVDEVHRAGSQNARRTKSLHAIRAKFRVCIGLTGTLVHAGVAPSLSIKDLAVPGLALFAKTWTAGETFKCLVKKKIGSRTVTGLERPPESTRQIFNEWLSIGVTLLTPESKEVQSAFTLPGQTLEEVTLNTPWPRLEDDVARVANQVFEETGEFPHAQTMAHLLARDGIDQKLDWLASELAQLPPGTPTVVFANYRDSLDQAQNLFDTLGRSYVRVDGDVVGADRAECQRKFQDSEVDVFLGQIHAASESMNLQRASISIALDVSWSCIDYSQALCRTHRRGQENPCIHVDLVFNHFQARVLDRLRSGQDFAAACAEYQEIKRTLESQSTH